MYVYVTYIYLNIWYKLTELSRNTYEFWSGLQPKAARVIGVTSASDAPIVKLKVSTCEDTGGGWALGHNTPGGEG